MIQKKKRILVCGGRDFTNNYVFHKEMTKIFRNLDITSPYQVMFILGLAKGADDLGLKMAQKNQIEHATYPANWNAHGKAAGMITNRQMRDEGKADHVVAFPGGKGTANMVSISRQVGIPVTEIHRPNIEVINKHLHADGDDGGEYIGRGSPLGNPFRMNHEKDRDTVIDKYRTWIENNIRESNPHVLDELSRLLWITINNDELKLQCFCAPKPCHGDIIREILLRGYMKG